MAPKPRLNFLSAVPPDEAGSLSAAEVARIPRAPRAVGTLCELAADAIERAGKAFQPPAGVTPDSLRKAGERADGMDLVIHDIEVLRNRHLNPGFWGSA